MYYYFVSNETAINKQFRAAIINESTSLNATFDALCAYWFAKKTERDSSKMQ